MARHALHVRPVDLSLAQRQSDCICGKHWSDGETCVWCGHGIIEPPPYVKRPRKRRPRRRRRG